MKSPASVRGSHLKRLPFSELHADPWQDGASLIKHLAGYGHTSRPLRLDRTRGNQLDQNDRKQGNCVPPGYGDAP